MGKRKAPVGRNMGGAKRKSTSYAGPSKSTDKRHGIGRDALGRDQDFNSKPWPKFRDQARDQYGRWT